jgi:protein SCO1/2
MSRVVVVCSSLLAVLVLAGCGSGSEPSAGSSEPAATATVDEGWAGAAPGNPQAVPDFTLTDQDGKRVRFAELRGKVVLLTFLYTNCPDVCPLIAENLNSALRKLPPAERAEVRVLAISVDPKRDTPAQVRGYVKVHRLLPQFRYLIGTKRELTAVWRKLDVQAVARDPDLVDHTTYTLLVDQTGHGIVFYSADFTSQDVLHDLRRILEA